MAFWDNFKKSLGGDRDAMQKIVDTLSPWNIAKRNIQDNTKRVLGVAKKAAEVGQPVIEPVGKVAGFLGKGAMAPFQALGIMPGAGTGGTALRAGARIGTTRVGQQIAQQTGTDINAILKDGMDEYAAQTAAEAAIPFDPLLQVAAVAEEKVFSPLVKRPISTAALLTDPESPLFEDDAYGKGFQLSDVQTAYDRSKEVSLGVALTKSYLNPFHVTGISDAILEDGGIDIDRVNLWDDQDIQANFVDNTTGRWMTGFTDALVGNVAVVGAVNRSVSALRAAARAAGFNNRINVYDADAINKLEKLADDHISGQTQTVFGSDVVTLANTKDIVLINRILKPHTNNPRLASLIKETEDPTFVRDLLLADKGYAPAINRLMGARKADDLWYSSNAADEIFADFAKTGQYRSYNAQAKERWSQAFDDAIAKNPESQRVFDAFMRDQFDAQTGRFIPEPRVLGTTYKPVEPIVGREALIKGREFKQRFGAATEVRDYSNIGGVVQTIIGSGKRGGAATALIHFTGSKLPRGIISNSGLRPGDMVEELNAWLDDIPLFARGTNQVRLNDGTVMKASDYRRNLIDKALVLKTDGQRESFFQNMNEEVAIDVFATMGIGRVQAKQFIDNINESIYKYHGDLKRDSYAMDPSGVRAVISPQTQRQLSNATPLVPLGKIVREALRIKGSFNPVDNVFTDLGKGLFEAGNKLFSFTQLVRPTYIPKNSIFEPLLSAVQSQGSQFLFDSAETFAKNAMFNNRNRFNQLVNKANIKSSARRKALKEEYAQYTEQYDRAVDLVDNSVAEWVEFFINPAARSPVTRAEFADIVKDDLRAAERLINNLEGKMRVRAREFGLQREEVPTLYGLVRRVQYLKTLKDPKIAGDIRAAELAITKASGDINTLAPDLNTLNATIKKAYDDIDKLLVDMGPSRKKLADEFSVVDNARIRRRGRQEPDGYVMSNGETVKIPRLENENSLGTSYKAEISNRHTREMELLGDKTFAKRTQILGRRDANRITDVTDPLYFDELAYVANNYMRGDVLIDQILAGRTRDEIIQNWGMKRGGRSYAEEFGRDSSEIIDMIDDQIAYVNRYLPTLEAKAAVAAGEVRGNQLAQLLGDKLDRLTPINPLDNKYSTPIEQSKNFLEAIDRASSKAWTAIGAPENAIRWAWGSVELRNRTIDKLEMLAAQGFEVNTGTINSVRQAAAVEMVKEAEKTFYSIRRQNRALYLARTVLSFPAASASGIYRYTRFAAKSPQRMSGFLNSYYGIYNSFGVDKYGNPVDDVFDAEYLLVPGTKELGLNAGKGIMVGTRAVNFIANFAGPAYTVPIAVGQVLALKPGNDQVLQKAIDDTFGKLPGYSYKELFPFGIETDLGKAATQAFTPAWARNFLLYLNGDDSKKDWVDTFTSEWNYQMALYEMGIGVAPTEELVAKQSRKKFLEKALWQFASPLGTAAVVDMRKDSIFRTYYNAAVEKYKALGFSDRQAKGAAESDLNTRMSMLGKKVEFPMDRLYFGSKRRPKAAYVTPTAEAYNRVWEEFSGLANELGKEDKNLIGLITADLRGSESDANIARLLNRPGTTLPDGTTLNLPLVTVEDVERDIEVSRVWKAYGEYKRQLNDLAKSKGYATYSSVPELREALKAYALQLGQFSDSWLFEYNRRASEDVSYKYAWGLTKIVKDDKFMEKHGNSQFWVHAEAIMRYRRDYVNLYKEAPTGYKSVVQNAWRDYVNSVLDVVDPKLADILDRYFENDNLTEVNID
jgi:hypothetical protein